MTRRRTLLRVLAVAALLTIVLVGTGLAYSRGYLMGFTYNGQSISRDEFLALVDQQAPMGCTVVTNFIGLPAANHCFDTEEALEQFMATPAA